MVPPVKSIPTRELAGRDAVQPEQRFTSFLQTIPLVSLFESCTDVHDRRVVRQLEPAT